MLIKKSPNALQSMLNKVTQYLPVTKVSAAAYSKARKKILHTAFIELSQVIVNGVYSNGDYKTYKNSRLLAVDGSRLRIPDGEETKRDFGVCKHTNPQTNEYGEHAYARLSTMYDVLNNITVDASLSGLKTDERIHAHTHLKYVKGGDILLYDRGYYAYGLMANIAQHKAHFVIRCKRGSGKVIDHLFKGNGGESIVTNIPKPIKSSTTPDITLPKSLTVRYVSIVLSTGEIEVLATSLMHETIDELKVLYGKRWGVETHYDILKNRLALENFTGMSSESVRQDVFVSIFLCNLESLLTSDTNDVLEAKENTKYKQQVNKAVSFNLLKERAFDILLKVKSIDTILDELTELFVTTPTLYRPDKVVERVKKRPAKWSLNFWKRKKKLVG